MFTGLITATGRIAQIAKSKNKDMANMRIVASTWDYAGVSVGASIAVNGICLTVAEIWAEGFGIHASGETLARTTMQAWQKGDKVNLERALKLGDELGGHFTFGHVDCVAELTAIEAAGESRAITITAPDSIMPLLAEKGSVAIDGISLTINNVAGNRFSVMVIPHTWENTTLMDNRAGDMVNLEADMLARYVARQLQKG